MVYREIFSLNRGKDFKSKHLDKIVAQLEFVFKLSNCHSERGIVKSLFGTISQNPFPTSSVYPGALGYSRSYEQVQSEYATHK